MIIKAPPVGYRIDGKPLEPLKYATRPSTRAPAISDDARARLIEGQRVRRRGRQRLRKDDPDAIPALRTAKPPVQWVGFHIATE